MARISQAEARRLRKRVEELEEHERRRRSRWSSAWPGGVHLWTLDLGVQPNEAVRVSLALGHACVLKAGTGSDAGKALLYAITHEDMGL